MRTPFPFLMLLVLAFNICVPPHARASEKLSVTLRRTFGAVGPTRRTPHQAKEKEIYLSVDLAGLTRNGEGKYHYESWTELIDPDGNIIARTQSKAETRPPLFGDGKTCRAQILVVDSDLPSGAYQLKGWLQDLNTSTSVFVELPLTVVDDPIRILKPQWIYNVTSFSWASGHITVGELIHFQCTLTAEQHLLNDQALFTLREEVTDLESKQIIIDHQWELSAGTMISLGQRVSPQMPEPIYMHFRAVSSARPGTFSYRLTVSDPLSGFSTSVELPYRVHKPAGLD